MDFLFESTKDSFNCCIRSEINTLPHLHHYAELIYIISGKLNMTINKKHANLYAGDLAVVFPNDVHCAQYSEDFSMLHFTFTPDFISNGLKTALTSHSMDNPFFSTDELNILSQNTISTIINSNLYDECIFDDKYCASAYKGVLLILMNDILSKTTLSKKNHCCNHSLCQTTLNYIEQHFTENIHLEHVAKKVGTNKYTLSRMFSNELGISYTEYISMLRLEYARQLLLQSKKNIMDIMSATGFNNERTFYRNFKNHYGVTPRQFRNYSP